MPTIRENLLRAIQLVEDEPAQLLDLSSIVRETGCGTLHCVIGLCVTDPFFRDQGLRMYGWMLMVGEQIAGRGLPPMFGTDAWDRLFHRRGWGTWDQPWLDPEDGHITDKELALMRLNKQLEEYPE